MTLTAPGTKPKILFYPNRDVWVVEYDLHGQRAEKIFANERHDRRQDKIDKFLKSLNVPTSTAA
jgi:hypothetical protein